MSDTNTATTTDTDTATATATATTATMTTNTTTPLNKSSCENLGDRMKMYETSMNTLHIEGNVPFVIRLDGHGFSKFTRKFVKPWDIRVHNAMVEAANVLMKEFNPSLIYSFSDEITMCFPALSDEEYQERIKVTQGKTLVPFSGKVQKLITLSAGAASTSFYKSLAAQHYDTATDAELIQHVTTSLPHFDARIFVLPSNQEILNNLIWRSVFDCKRNSVSGLAQAHFPHKMTQGKGSGQMKEMLLTKGINYDDEPDWYKYGVFLKRQYHTFESVSPVTKETVQSQRTRFRMDSFNINLLPTALDYVTIKTLPEDFTLVTINPTT
ncbi:hypothetical protein SAMD00019534_081660, partial [Acytostelium subglobosum LB1]|uniref:hypothetical protein n=1 Tax=Acytostelium subglobosum LB1 TaxID=1410327 RepID=UPI000644EA01